MRKLSIISVLTGLFFLITSTNLCASDEPVAQECTLPVLDQIDVGSDSHQFVMSNRLLDPSGWDTFILDSGQNFDAHINIPNLTDMLPNEISTEVVNWQSYDRDISGLNPDGVGYQLGVEDGAIKLQFPSNDGCIPVAPIDRKITLVLNNRQVVEINDLPSNGWSNNQMALLQKNTTTYNADVGSSMRHVNILEQRYKRAITNVPDVTGTQGGWQKTTTNYSSN